MKLKDIEERSPLMDLAMKDGIVTVGSYQFWLDGYRAGCEATRKDVLKQIKKGSDEKQ